MTKQYDICLLPGDGIGPEIIAEGVKVLNAVGAKYDTRFDCKESLIGQMIKNLPVRNITTLDEFCRENLPEAAFLCIPKKAAVQISDQLVRLGIKGFWNFSHYDIAHEVEGVVVENVHLGDSLMTLSYQLKKND